MHDTLHAVNLGIYYIVMNNKKKKMLIILERENNVLGTKCYDFNFRNIIKSGMFYLVNLVLIKYQSYEY